MRRFERSLLVVVGITAVIEGGLILSDAIDPGATPSAIAFFVMGGYMILEGIDSWGSR